MLKGNVDQTCENPKTLNPEPVGAFLFDSQPCFFCCWWKKHWGVEMLGLGSHETSPGFIGLRERERQLLKGKGRVRVLRQSIWKGSLGWVINDFKPQPAPLNNGFWVFFFFFKVCLVSLKNHPKRAIPFDRISPAEAPIRPARSPHRSAKGPWNTTEPSEPWSQQPFRGLRLRLRFAFGRSGEVAGKEDLI